MEAAKEQEQLWEDLRTDRCLSASQVASYYGLQACDLTDDFMQVRHRIGDTRNSRHAPPVVFVGRQSELADLAAHELRHLAGVAAMRRELSGAAEDWELISLSGQHLEAPDGVWYRPQGGVALEYDVGSYSRKTIRAKARAFALTYTGQIWAAPTQRRASTLRATLQDAVSETVPVLVSPWQPAQHG